MDLDWKVLEAMKMQNRMDLSLTSKPWSLGGDRPCYHLSAVHPLDHSSSSHENPFFVGSDARLETQERTKHWPCSPCICNLAKNTFRVVIQPEHTRGHVGNVPRSTEGQSVTCAWTEEKRREDWWAMK